MMIICKNCYIPMVQVIGFRPNEKDRHDKYCRCPKCYRETKHYKVENSELSFREYMNKELRKAGK
mgnify:CR=1 FL=1